MRRLDGVVPEWQVVDLLELWRHDVGGGAHGVQLDVLSCPGAARAEWLHGGRVWRGGVPLRRASLGLLAERQRRLLLAQRLGRVEVVLRRAETVASVDEGGADFGLRLRPRRDGALDQPKR